MLCAAMRGWKLCRLPCRANQEISRELNSSGITLAASDRRRRAEGEPRASKAVTVMATAPLASTKDFRAMASHDVP